MTYCGADDLRVGETFAAYRYAGSVFTLPTNIPDPTPRKPDSPISPVRERLRW
jgi:hypothetical protein